MNQPFDFSHEVSNIDRYVAEGRRMRAEAMREFITGAAKRFSSKTDDLA